MNRLRPTIDLSYGDQEVLQRVLAEPRAIADALAPDDAREHSRIIGVLEELAQAFAEVFFLDRLVARDIADRSNGGVARLSGALGDRIGDGEDLCGLLIKKQVIVPEVGSGDVPVEIFCLQVNRVAVRQNDLQSVGDSHRRAFVKIRRCRKGGGIVVRHRLDFLNLATRDPAPIPPRMAMYRR